MWVVLNLSLKKNSIKNLFMLLIFIEVTSILFAKDCNCLQMAAGEVTAICNILLHLSNYFAYIIIGNSKDSFLHHK